MSRWRRAGPGLARSCPPRSGASGALACAVPPAGRGGGAAREPRRGGGRRERGLCRWAVQVEEQGNGGVGGCVWGSRGAGAAAAAAVLAGSRCWSILAWGCVCADGNFWRSRCVNAFGTGCCSDAEAQELCVRACTLSIAAAGTAGHCSVPRVDEGPCVALPLTGAACPHPLRSCCRHEF